MAVDAPGRKPRLRPSKRVPLGGGVAADQILQRVPPHSEEAEAAVLAGVFLRKDVINSLADFLEPDDFYIPGNRLIYNSFLQLTASSRPIDPVTVAEDLRSRNEYEDAGGAARIGQLTQASVIAANAEHYGRIVRDKALQRRLIEACSVVLEKAFEPVQDVDELLDESEQAVFSVSSRTSKATFASSKSIMDKVFTDLSRLADAKDTITGVTTGFEQLNRLTSGLQNSDLVIVAARPSMGKTAFALCCALNAALLQNITVGVFSLEMSREQLLQRMLSIRGHVDLSKLRQPAKLLDEDWQSLYQAADVISGAPIFIDDSPALSTLELRARARRLKSEHNLGLVVIDYLQLMRSSRRTDSRELEISDISRSLKGLAKELNIPVMALAQLNRKVEERVDKRPILADLRESGAIEQDADVIMFVYRDDVYKFKKPSERPEVGEAEIIIGKQRNGPVGVAQLEYVGRYTAFNSASYYAPSEDTIS